MCVSCHLSSLVFFMFPRSVVWCLTLTLKKFSSLLFQIFLLLHFLLFCFWYSRYTQVIPFVITFSWIFCSEFLFVSLLICLVFSLLFNVGCFYWLTLKVRDAFLSVQSEVKHLKVTFISLTVLMILEILFLSFLIISTSLLT